MDIGRIRDKGNNFRKRLVPATVVQSRLHKRTIMQFAEKVGMVYFGFVDQHRDEHSLVRGLTMSSTHRDSNYCIGTFDGYDIALVERTDTLQFPGKPPQPHTWLIMTFDLHSLVDLPHVFMGLHTHGETFYANLFTKFAGFTKIDMGTYGDAHDAAFAKRYAVYAPVVQAISAERLFHPAVTKQILDHFGGMTLEIFEGTLYVYIEHQRPTTILLDRMLRNGLWLAKTLDSQAASL